MIFPKTILPFFLSILNKFIKKNKENPNKPIDKTYQITYTPTSNKGTRTADIDSIVIHHTATDSDKSVITWFTTTWYRNSVGKMIRNYVSAHYVISRTGKITQLVLEKDKANHAGYSRLGDKDWVNNFSIGIELVGNGVTKPYTEEQYEALIWLVKGVLERHPKITKDRIVSHSAIRANYKNVHGNKNKRGELIEDKVDPGPKFDWERLQKGL